MIRELFTELGPNSGKEKESRDAVFGECDRRYQILLDDDIKTRQEKEAASIALKRKVGPFLSQDFGQGIYPGDVNEYVDRIVALPDEKEKSE